MRYYGLLAGLPTPRVGQSLPLAIPELRAQVEQYLEGADREWVHLFFHRIDWHNAASAIAATTSFEKPSASQEASATYKAAEDPLWLEGGNMDAQQLERWLRLGPEPDSPFHNPDRMEGADPGERLGDWWQVYYTLLAKHPDRDLKRLLAYDATLRNFQGGHLYRTLSQGQSGLASEPERLFRYLPGGWFDRFAYVQGQIGDVRAEHPFTASVLAHFDHSDAVARQTAMQEARLAFYEHVAFFEPFGLAALAARLFAYTDRQMLDLQNEKLGAARLQQRLDTWMDQYEHGGIAVPNAAPKARSASPKH